MSPELKGLLESHIKQVINDTICAERGNERQVRYINRKVQKKIQA
jgi:hypothetical protein